MRLIMMVSSRDGLRTNRDKVDLYHRGISPYSIVLRFSWHLLSALISQLGSRDGLHATTRWSLVDQLLSQLLFLDSHLIPMACIPFKHYGSGSPRANMFWRWRYHPLKDQFTRRLLESYQPCIAWISFATTLRYCMSNRSTVNLSSTSHRRKKKSNFKGAGLSARWLLVFLVTPFVCHYDVACWGCPIRNATSVAIPDWYLLAA